jgi:hypothetical protein
VTTRRPTLEPLEDRTVPTRLRIVPADQLPAGTVVAPVDPEGVGRASLATGDFNGDGLPDRFERSLPSEPIPPSLRPSFGQPDGTFVPRVYGLPIPDPFFFRLDRFPANRFLIADFNADGKDDALRVFDGFAELEYGPFDDPLQYVDFRSGVRGAVAPIVGRFGGPSLGLVTLNPGVRADGRRELSLNAQPFGETNETLLVPAAVTDGAPADVDGDGRDELVYTDATAGGRQMVLFFDPEPAAPPFPAVRPIPALPPRPETPGPTGDVNGDGIRDRLERIGGTAFGFYLQRGRADGTFDEPGEFVGGGNIRFDFPPTERYLVDVDADGRDELISFTPPRFGEPGFVSVNFDVSGGASPDRSFSTGGARDVVFGRFGGPDLSLVAFGRLDDGGSAVTLFRGPIGTTPGVTLDLPVTPGSDAFPADLDGDGRDELVFNTRAGTPLAVFFDTEPPPPPPAAVRPRVIPLAALPPRPPGGAAEFGDFNGDGIADRVIEVRDSPDDTFTEIDVQFGRPGGGFDEAGGQTVAFASTIPRFVVPRPLALVRDLDGDGRDDLLLLRPGDASLLSEVRYGPFDRTAPDESSVVDRLPDVVFPVAAGVTSAAVGRFGRPGLTLLTFADPGPDGTRRAGLRPLPPGLTDAESFTLPAAAGGYAADVNGDGIDELVFTAADGRPAAIYFTPPADAPAGLAVGTGVGVGPVVQLFAPDGTRRRSVDAFDPAFTGGVRVASADFNGDGVADAVAGSGPGVAAWMRVLDGRDGTELFAVSPFGDFAGGVGVAAGDVDGDGVPDLVLAAGNGGGPRVKVISGRGFTTLADFFGIGDPDFRGGCTAAVGDVNGDRAGDLTVFAGPGGGPRAAVYDGRAVGGAEPVKLVADFFAFELDSRVGGYVAAGDLDGDGRAEVVFGAGPGGGPRVAVLSADGRTPLANFYAGSPSDAGGVPVAVRDADGDGRPDLVTGAGGRVRVYRGSSLPGGPEEVRAFAALDGLIAGVFVG